MEKLEICVNALRVNRLAFVPFHMEKCRYCTAEVLKECDNYKPYSPTRQIPIRYGKLAIDFMKQFYHDNISIEGLPHEVK